MKPPSSNDLRLLGRTGVGWKEQSVLARNAANVRRRHPSLGLQPPEQRLERTDPAEPLETEHDTAERNRSTREPRAAAARRDRDAALAAPGHDLDDLFRGPREDDCFGVPFEATGLCRVG